MNIFFKVMLVVLVFLAVSSGITKIVLTERDVEFFGKYGFTNLIVIAYGAAQLLGGILLVPPRTRITGAILIAVTFSISAILLVLDQKFLVALITLFFVAILGLIARRTARRVPAVAAE